MFARLAKDNIGFVDWSPYLATVSNTCTLHVYFFNKQGNDKFLKSLNFQIYSIRGVYVGQGVEGQPINCLLD